MVASNTNSNIKLLTQYMLIWGVWTISNLAILLLSLYLINSSFLTNLDIKALIVFSIATFWLLGTMFLISILTKLSNWKKQNSNRLNILEESENKFRTIVNNISDVIWIMDVNKNYTYLSPSIENVTGYTIDEYKKLPYEQTHSKRSSVYLIKLFNEGLKNIEEGNLDLIDKTYTLEEELIHKNGQIIYSEFTAMLTHDLSGKINGIQGVTRDISERRKTNKKLEQSEYQLKKLIATKDKFFSIIAHDLKDPFNSLLGFSELLSESYFEYDDNKRLEFIRLIESSAHQSFELLKNLLEWARTQTNRIEYKPTNINLKQEINTSYELLKLSIEAKKIIFENNVDDLSLVLADNYMLQTILQNLLSNAIKFTEPEGKISFESKIEEEMIFITIKDTGIGIDSEIIDKLFKIDESFSTKGTADEKGTGLGLIICKEFINKHDGTINVESQKGKGSKFTFSIPKAVLQ